MLFVHFSIWQALQDQDVDAGYVRFSQRLYRDQVGEVRTDRTSKRFKIERGSRQGDPLSPKIFNAVLEHIMRPLKQKWIDQGLGVWI